MNPVICEICEQPGGDPCSGLHLTENECICALLKRVGELEAKVVEQHNLLLRVPASWSRGRSDWRAGRDLWMDDCRKITAKE